MQAKLSQRWPRDAPYVWVSWKFSGVHGYISQNFYWAFVPIEPINVHYKFEVHSFTCSWDNREYQSLDTPHFLFSIIFHGLLFGWTLWLYWPNLKAVALAVPEIIGGMQKIWAVSGYAHASFSPKFFMGFWSHGPSNCTGQIWKPYLYPFVR